MVTRSPSRTETCSGLVPSPLILRSKDRRVGGVPDVSGRISTKRPPSTRTETRTRNEILATIPLLGLAVRLHRSYQPACAAVFPRAKQGYAGTKPSPPPPAGPC